MDHVCAVRGRGRLRAMMVMAVAMMGLMTVMIMVMLMAATAMPVILRVHAVRSFQDPNPGCIYPIGVYSRKREAALQSARAEDPSLAKTERSGAGLP